jgi:hypothetical protein
MRVICWPALLAPMQMEILRWRQAFLLSGQSRCSPQLFVVSAKGSWISSASFACCQSWSFIGVN